MRKIAGFNVEFEKFIDELYDGSTGVWYMFIATDDRGRRWAEHYNFYDNIVENVDTARDSEMLESFTDEEDAAIESGINDILIDLAINNENNGTLTYTDEQTGKVTHYAYSVDSLEEAQPMIDAISDYFNN